MRSSGTESDAAGGLITGNGQRVDARDWRLFLAAIDRNRCAALEAVSYARSLYPRSSMSDLAMSFTRPALSHDAPRAAMLRGPAGGVRGRLETQAGKCT